MSDETSGLQKRVIAASWVGTAVFVATGLPSALDIGAFHLPAAIVALVLFAIGIVSMLYAFAIAVNRSRRDLIGMGGLFFGAGSIPKTDQRLLLGSLALQVVLSFVFASMRLFTASAFGTLVPMFGLGLTGVVCAKFGSFDQRTDIRR